MMLDEVLNHEMAEGLTVVNKGADLKRQVLAVESTENPDAFPYLETNSIVITTAMVFKNDTKGLCDFITGLCQHSCAAIAIKIGRYLDKLDDDVIKKADELKFPLLLIEKHETLGKVYRRLLAILWNVKNREILEAHQVKRRLYKLFLNGATLHRMLNTISSVMQRHVLIVDMLGGLLYENGTATEEETRRALQAMEQMDIKNILWPAVKTVEDSQMIIYPVEFIRENTYFFVVFDNKPDSSILVMEEILLMISNMLYKNLSVVYNEIWKGNSFLKHFVSINEIGWSGTQIMSEGKEYGLRLSLRYQIVVGRFIRLEKYKFNNIQFTHREEKYINGFQSIKKILWSLYHNKVVLLGDMDNWQYVLLIQGNCERLEETLIHIEQQIENLMNEKIIFYMGSTCNNITEAASSYWEINDNIAHLNGISQVSGVISYKPKDVNELLREIPLNQSRKVCQKWLKELAFPDNDVNRELRKTLEAYLESGCSISETSKKLFIHRNTVRYRIKKCEEILGMEITPANLSFELQLCLKLSD